MIKCQISFFLVFGMIVLLCTGSRMAKADNQKDDKLRKSIELIKMNCRDKFSEVTLDRAKAIEEGVRPTDRAGKCYLNCILHSIGMMQRGRFDYEVTKKLMMGVMPRSAQAEYQDAISQCQIAGISEPEPCSLATAIYFCFKDHIKNFDFI